MLALLFSLLSPAYASRHKRIHKVKTPRLKAGASRRSWVTSPNVTFVTLRYVLNLL
jgi:hypothetical protein